MVYVALLPLAVILRAVLMGLKPMVHIRFGRLWCERLGVFASIPELYLCERDAQMQPTAGLNLWYHWDRDVFYLKSPLKASKAVANQQLEVMWRRTFRVHDPVRHLDYLNRLLPPGSKEFTVNLTYEMDDHKGLLDRFPSHLAFTAEEEQMQGETSNLTLGTHFLRAHSDLLD